jgi:hypothetical protein
MPVSTKQRSAGWVPFKAPVLADTGSFIDFVSLRGSLYCLRFTPSNLEIIPRT